MEGYLHYMRKPLFKFNVAEGYFNIRNNIEVETQGGTDKKMRASREG